ncbi:hypothetical protein RDV78_09800 [Bacillota bacterium LX-D]|nr:hypothetical protein [Bacillota bacterium LX-D]
MNYALNFIEGVVEQRIDNICNGVTNEDWYKELQDRLISIRKILEENMNGDRELLDKYNLLCLEISFKTCIEVYKKAIMDSNGLVSKLVSKQIYIK